MRHVIGVLGVCALTSSASAGVIITGIMDGTLTGGQPKAIELFVSGTEDLSNFDLLRESNGPGVDGTFNMSGVFTNQYVYLLGSGDTTDFASIFGTLGDFANTQESSIVSGNGNDAFSIAATGTTIPLDMFGDGNDIGAGFPWDYLDSWAYRANGTGPDGGFAIGNWSFGGPNALDGLSTSDIAAAVPFGTYQVPTPGSLALLGLSGFVASRRRR